MKITRIEGIGSTYAEKLSQETIKTTQALLKFAASRKGRADLASRTGIPEKMILEWVNRADLMRVKGIGEEYSDLLEASGVDSPRELGNRRPDNLYHKMLEINSERRLVRRIPSMAQVERWVSSAKILQPLVTH